MTGAARKPPVRRNDRDGSQRIRWSVQGVFLAINVWIGVQFYLWVRAMETGARAGTRPPGVEGYLPIAGLMNVKAWALTRQVPLVHPAAMFLLVAFLAISLLLKKAFCSWLCPIGTVSEWLWRVGRRIFKRNFAMPKWLDVAFRSLKYLLLAFFVAAIWKMDAETIAGFMQSPYGAIADVKLLNFFRFIGTTGAIVIAVIAVASLFVQNFWCRYLCPYGALLGIPSLLSPARIRRDPVTCIDCSKCTKACPSRLPVDKLPQVRSAECTLCMQCVAVCPVKDALRVKVTPKRALSPAFVAAAIAAIFLAIVIAARATNHWATPLPDDVYRSLVQNAPYVSH